MIAWNGQFVRLCKEIISGESYDELVWKNNKDKSITFLLKTGNALSYVGHTVYRVTDQSGEVVAFIFLF